MKSSKFKILILILFSIKFINSTDIGSSCILKSGASGSCQEWNNCSIIKDLWAKRTITRAHVMDCNLFKRTICCPFSLADETTTQKLTTTTFESDEDIKTSEEFVTRPKPTEPTTTQAAIKRKYSRDEERISQKKCKEYGKAVMKILKITPLLGQPARESSISKCNHKSVSLIIGRIGSGTEASLGEFPHQALLGYSPRNTDIKWICGGSLVSPRFVLTAAHCLFESQNGHVKKVKVGMRNKDQDHDNEKVFIYNIQKTFKHPNYNDQTFNEDIALLKLDGIVPINEHILPICLPTHQHEDFKVMATGFGRTQPTGQQSDVLLKVTLERFTYDECKNAYPEDGIVQIEEDTMVCYGHHKERKDICRGDSGGPLQISNENNVHCTYTQIGISSFGPNRCGTAGFPSGFTNVYNYLDWIENIVWEDEQ